MGANKKPISIFRYVFLPGLFVFIIVVVVNLFIYKLESTFFYNIYNNEVAGTKALISRRFQSALIAAESTGALFVSSEDVTKEEFDSFATILTQSTSSESIAVPTMIEWVDTKNVIRYAYPVSAKSAEVIGLDMNKYPNRLIPIIKAKTTKSAVVSEPIMFVEGYPGLLVYYPIFKDSNYLGQIIVAVRMSNLLAPIPGESPVYQKNIYIQTGNFIIPFDDDIILNNNGERVVDAQGNLVKDSLAQEYSDSKNVVTEYVVFADKTWQLKFSPTYTAEITKRVIYYAGFSLIFIVDIIILLLILNQRQKRLVKEMAKSEALVFGIDDGLMAMDKNGIITFVNKRAEELSGYDSKDVIGKSYYDFWLLVDSKGVRIPQETRPFHQAIFKKEVIRISVVDHLWVLKKDGTRFPIASSISPIIVNGEVAGSIMLFRDITKESEIDRMKTEFLSLASHQLLTPSTSIKWISELLLKGDFGALKKKQQEVIKNIYVSNESMISLINSLLNISRIESGRIIVSPKPTYLSEIVTDVAKELKNKIGAKKQVFIFEPEKNLPKINVDPHLIGEVYKNFLTNAIKYTPEKGKITVNIAKVGDNIISKVIDTGYGIPAKDKGRVFEKFYRGENILSVEKEGNGLGLYLVKQIIEVSGGKVGFESEEGKGTTFWFSLPISGSSAKPGEVSIS